MSVLVFIGVYAIGNPVELLISPEATQAEREQTMRNLGFDRPLWEQYLLFLKGALRGELGNSYIHNIPALKLILQRLPATFELAIMAIFIATVLGIPLGLWLECILSPFSAEASWEGPFWVSVSPPSGWG